LLQLAAVGGVVVVTVFTGPGLGALRNRVAHAPPGWLIAGVGLEVLSALCYVVIFRAVFCPRMSWRLSYQIGMSEQGANSVLSVSGSGGLALGAWALHRGGMSSEQIGGKSIASFFLTSLANVVGVVAFAALYVGRSLGHDPNATLTDGLRGRRARGNPPGTGASLVAQRVHSRRLRRARRVASPPFGHSRATRLETVCAAACSCCDDDRPTFCLARSGRWPSTSWFSGSASRPSDTRRRSACSRSGT
jgi:hypothetical protein